MNRNLILGIETSCDETAAAVIEQGERILSNVISSQVATHQKFGGVVPEIASRHHLENLPGVVDQALQEAGVGFEGLTAIAVTNGPGLVGALLVGVAGAKAMAAAQGIPLIGVNHIEGHIYANFLSHENLQFPMLCLLVSGGHTHLVLLENHGKYQVLGRTRDDAVGEAFDKVARAMGLGYPGGPRIQAASELGNPQAIDLPRAWLEPGSLDFSFSGMKSAVLNFLNRAAQKGETVNTNDLAASFQCAVVDILVSKTLAAARNTGVKTILLAGGVAANQELRRRLAAACQGEGLNFYYPPVELCTDNAAMIACAGYFKFLRGELAPPNLNAVPGMTLFYA
ncbi:MAG TPA: tRNA (adenosine(37)-N6)-threonylcarbamoyltransferase complex transferase subunit TsaD [Verrucomicrobiae bacterium]|nr:tRNA (adenosine(37)-N6)-threonylcarbamoyltransferase complex transferase subunit TsaD [Verrucomicrobiae bacterium]